MADPQKHLVINANPQPYTRAADFRVIYADNSILRVGATDIQITFSLLKDNPGQSGQYFEEQIAAVFSPQHAKQIAQAISEGIKAYEAQFGTINVASSVLTSQLIQDALKQAQEMAEQAQKK